MNILIAYYAFLIAGPVLFMVMRESPMVSQKRSVYFGYLLAPPLILVVQTWNLSFLLGAAFLVSFILLVNLLGRPQVDQQPTTPTTLRLWLIIWSLQAVLPISLHFVLRTRPDTERLSLLVAGLSLVAGTLLTFLVFAPDLRKRA